MNNRLIQKQMAAMKSSVRNFMSVNPFAAFNALGLTSGNINSVLTLYPHRTPSQPFIVKDTPSLPVAPTLSIDHNLDFTGITTARFLIGSYIRQYVGCSDVPAGSPSIYGICVSQANNIDDSNKLAMTGIYVDQQAERPTPSATGILGASSIGSGFAYTEANTNVLTGIRGLAGFGHHWSNCKAAYGTVSEVSNTGAAYGQADDVIAHDVRLSIRGTNDVVNGSINVTRFRSIKIGSNTPFGSEVPTIEDYRALYHDDTIDYILTNSTTKWFIYSDSFLESYFRGKLHFDNTVVAPADTGNKTINKPSGQVRIAAASSSVVVTNDKVTADSVIIATVASNDSTLKTVAVVASAGSFEIFGNAPPTAETLIKWVVFN